MSKPRHRSKARSRASKKYFTKTATRQHPKNYHAIPMRGGYRI